MTQNSKLENMKVYGDLRSNCEAIKFGEKVKGTTESGDSFVVEMEGLSHLIEKDINANSRITRNLTRKASIRTMEKKVTGNKDREDSTTLISSSRGMKPVAALHGSTLLPEKSGLVAVGSMDQSVVVPQGGHHQITITNGCVSSAAGTETKSGVGKRFGFRRSSRAWTTIDSRKIFFFFASLSCMGTILLIYFTLSMGRFDGDDNILN